MRGHRSMHTSSFSSFSQQAARAALVAGRDEAMSCGRRDKWRNRARRGVRVLWMAIWDFGFTLYFTSYDAIASRKVKPPALGHMVSTSRAPYRFKDTGGAGTHTRDTQDARAHTSWRLHVPHGSHRRTSQPSQPTNAPTRTTAHDDRNRVRLNSRSPGADRSPRPTQQRPPPANPTLTRPCRHPLPERLPAPARRRSAK